MATTLKRLYNFTTSVSGAAQSIADLDPTTLGGDGNWQIQNDSGNANNMFVGNDTQQTIKLLPNQAFVFTGYLADDCYVVGTAADVIRVVRLDP